jgi:hypothetical protein
MKTQKLIVIAAIVCLMVGASGPAQAKRGEDRVGASGPAQAKGGEDREDVLEIIADFCETVRNDAEETRVKLVDADDDLEKCDDDFDECRDGGLIGDGDPLVECLSEGLGCAGRAATDNVEACIEYKEEFADAYERALRAARFQDVEDEVQDFFSSRGRLRRICLAPAIQVARACSDNPE